MLILDWSLVIRIKLGHNTWYRRHTPNICVIGLRARRVVWSLDFSWFVGSQQTMALTTTFVLLIWLGSTERTIATSSILLLNQHAVLQLIMMKFYHLYLKNLADINDKHSSSTEENEEALHDKGLACMEETGALQSMEHHKQLSGGQTKIPFHCCT